RPPPPGPPEELHRPPPRREDPPRLLRPSRLLGTRNAVPDEEHARGGARLPRTQPHAAGELLRAAAKPATVQAALHDERLRPLRADRPLLPRRGPARRPAAGVHATRPRNELRAARGRDEHGRGGDGGGVQGGPQLRVPTAPAAHDLPRGDGPL